jgi:hypothetical protein
MRPAHGRVGGAKMTDHWNAEPFGEKGSVADSDAKTQQCSMELSHVASFVVPAAYAVF